MVKKSALATVESKIPDISGLATKSALTTIKNRIPDVSGLAANSALTAVEDKIPDITSLVTKTDFDPKLKAISDRATKNKTKNLLLDNELKKLKAFDTDYFVGGNYFEGDDGAENTLVFQVKSIYFRCDTGVKSVGDLVVYAHDVWKSKGSSDQSLHYSINGVVTTKLIRPTHVVLGAEEYFAQVFSIITNNSIVNIYIFYKLLPKTISTDNALKIVCLVELKQVDLIILKILRNISILDAVLAFITLEHLLILKII